jgi:DNA replication protein DnaC
VSPVAPPTGEGYGWTVDDSQKLDAAVARRVAAEQARANVPRIEPQKLVEDLAAKHGVDLDRLRDTERADRLLEEADIQAHAEIRAKKARIMASRLPVQYRDATFPRIPGGVLAMQWLEEYRAGSRASLVVLGPPGTGKTWISCAIARALLTEDMVPVTVVTAAAFLASLRPGSEGMDVDMLGYTLTPVLVLDDLGTERLTDWGAEQLYRLAHERSHNGRPTIVTSNMLPGDEYGKDPNTIKGRYDQRTVERLFGGAKLITLAGETLRAMPF